MKPFTLINDDKFIDFRLPTSLQEISNAYLINATAQVKIANDYTLVGLVYHEKLGNIILTRKQCKKSFSAGVIPIFIKSGSSDNDFLKRAVTKDKIIISSSQLQLAHHVIIPNNVLSLDFFIKHLDKDTTVASRYHNNYGNEECFFIEFKLVPNCDIVGYYHGTNTMCNEANKYFNTREIVESDCESMNESCDSDCES